MRSDRLSFLDDDEREFLYGYGVRTVIDLRGSQEIAEHPDIPISDDVAYRHITVLDLNIADSRLDELMKSDREPQALDFYGTILENTEGFRKTDTSDEEDVKALVAFAVDTFGSLDIMYNNAGIGDMAPIDQMTGENFKKLIDINLTGVFYGIKYAALQMEKQGTGGAIVSTSSIEGAVGDPNLPSYNAAKGGVNLMSQSAALALAKYHIRVNTVNPGYIETGRANEYVLGKEAIDHLVSLHPLGRLGKPEEIAHGVVFLVENEFTTGTHLYIDGGYTAQ